MKKIGRNAPCPCGKRTLGVPKKYKKYCINKPSPFSEKEAAKINQTVLKNTQSEHEEFEKQLKDNTCHLCSCSYEKYDLTKPCAHWLLRPDGIKKTS